MSLKRFTVLAIVLLLIIKVQAQVVYTDLIFSKVVRFPKFYNAEGKNTYWVTVEAENGAEAYWNTNTNGFVKNYLALDRLTLTDNFPAFRIKVKLYRKTDLATPIQYVLTDDKGKELLAMKKDDPRLTIPANTAYEVHMQNVIKIIVDEIQDAIDVTTIPTHLSQLYFNQSKEEFAKFTAVHKQVRPVLFNTIINPEQIANHQGLKSACVFWRNNYYTAPTVDKKYNPYRLLTAGNLALINALAGNVDSAKLWLDLAKKENSNYTELVDLEKFIAFQQENMQRFKACKAALGPVIFSAQIKQGNMQTATSKSVAPKEGEEFKEVVPNTQSGYFYKSGKKTEGDFVPLPGKTFDPSFMRFTAKGEKAVKLLTPFFADSVFVGADKYVPAGEKFGKLMLDNERLKVVYEIASIGEQQYSVYHIIKKQTNTTCKYFVGQVKFSKFLEKNFADCPKIMELVAAGAYSETTAKDAVLKFSNDYLLNCK